MKVSQSKKMVCNICCKTKSNSKMIPAALVRSALANTEGDHRSVLGLLLFPAQFDLRNALRALSFKDPRANLAVRVGA